MKVLFAFTLIVFSTSLFGQTEIKIWEKLEISFTSSNSYHRPTHDVRKFNFVFTSPTGIERKVNGFWDGGDSWKVRFQPDELGEWSWKSSCSDEKNDGLHLQQGVFVCLPNDSEQAIYKHGAIKHTKGKYHLSNSDGKPFFWVAGTAWNGPMKSTDEEWRTYLKHRRDHNYNTIQFVTTQFRGCDKNAEGLVAFEGSAEISINPEFFKRMDKKIDEINSYGLVASPAILWAIQFAEGRQLNPGYYLPVDEAVILAKYIVARYQGNQVVWMLAGDGRYYDYFEERWKTIGRKVFNGIDHAPVTMHPHGRSYIGDIYANEDWYDFMGYQSSHSNGEGIVNWINKGPMSKKWDKLKPMPYINLEPNYEEILFKIDADDVRNASWWSIFATPLAGITYGANGIWPWLREGESILNHSRLTEPYPDKKVSTWRKSMDFPGSIQIGYLSEFIQKLDWWRYFPADELLFVQPGDETYNAFVSVVATEDRSGILAYIPKKCTIEIRNLLPRKYTAQWYNPQTNEYTLAEFNSRNGKLIVEQNEDADMVIMLKSTSL